MSILLLDKPLHATHPVRTISVLDLSSPLILFPASDCQKFSTNFDLSSCNPQKAILVFQKRVIISVLGEKVLIVEKRSPVYHCLLFNKIHARHEVGLHESQINEHIFSSDTLSIIHEEYIKYIPGTKVP